jgi:hypothetical protein
VHDLFPTAIPQPWPVGGSGDHVSVSFHNVERRCAPSLPAPVAAALTAWQHVEWFADHARLEPLLADGALHLPDAPGHGMTLSPRADEWCFSEMEPGRRRP